MSRNKVFTWRFSRVVVAVMMCVYFGVMIYTILSSLKKDENLLVDLTTFAEDQRNRLSYLESTLDKLVNGRISALEQRIKYLEQQAQLNQISAAAAMVKAKTHHPISTPPAAAAAVELDEATLTQYFAKDTTVHPSLVFHYPPKINNNKRQQSTTMRIRDDVYVLSISSIHKRELQTAQQETFGQIFTLVFVEEMHTPVCVRCAAAAPGTTARVDLGNNLGWNCAQQRTLQALRLFLSQWRYWVDSLSWLMVVDDDTFVNHVALIRIVDGMDPRTMLVKVTHIHTRSTNTHDQHTLSMQAINTLSQYTLSTHSLIIPYQHTQLTHPYNPLTHPHHPTHPPSQPNSPTLTTLYGLAWLDLLMTHGVF